MSASVWQPGASSIAVNAENASLIQAFVATAGQTTFTLTQFTYVVGTGSIRIYRNGQKLPTSDITEIDSTHFSLPTTVLSEGELIECSAVLGSQDAVTAAAISAAASAAEAAASAASVDPANILYKADNLAGVADKAAARINLAVPQGYSSTIVGGSGALQIAGTDIMRFGSDTSGQLAGFRNKLINGSMSINQIGGFVGTLAAGVVQYGGPDRWFAYSAADKLVSLTMQLTGFPYCMRVQRASGQSNVAPIIVGQQIEGDTVLHLRGKTVTLSLYANAGANFSSAGGIITVAAAFGTVLDQPAVGGINGTWTGWTNSATTKSITTWGRQSYTFDIPSNASSMQVSFQYTPVGVAGAADYFEFTNVQLEVGSIASQVEIRPYALELMMCRRYMRKAGSAMVGVAETSSAMAVVEALSPPMRVSPTASLIAGVTGVFRAGTADVANGAIIVSAISTQPDSVWCLLAGFGSALTPGATVMSRNSGDNQRFLLLSAEF